MTDNQELTSKELDAHKGDDLSDKLLDCPFCGASAEMKDERSFWIEITHKQNCYFVEDVADLYFETKEALAIAWNTRAPSQTQQKLDAANETIRSQKQMLQNSLNIITQPSSERECELQQKLDVAVEALESTRDDIQVQALDMGNFTWIPTVEYEQVIERLEAALATIRGK
jgi:hypothetical protein